MDRKAIFEELKSILVKIKPSIDTEGINEQTRVVEELHLDSLTMILLSLAVENKFGFRFEGAPHFDTVGDAIDHIESHKV